MRVNMVGAFIRNAPFGTEIAFAKGMERRGHEVVRIDTSYPNQVWDQNADATLVFKWMEGDYWSQLATCRGPKIVYQPDDARFPHIMEMIIKMREYADCMLTFDDFGVKFARNVGYRDAEYMLLTADDELYSPDDTVERDIDVSFIGSLTRGSNHVSRIKMCEIVQEEANRRGWKTAFGEAYFDGRGPTPVEIYRRSKVVLNHATDVGQGFGRGYGLQCRHFEAAMTRTAVLSNETHERSWMLRFNSQEGLLSCLDELIERDNPQMYDEGYGLPMWKSWGNDCYDWVQGKNRPEHRADQLVKFIERNS